MRCRLVKGIILSGGSGTRLYPLTISTSKQLLPVYDKPMIYYPLYTLMSACIDDILVISSPSEISRYEQVLKDGSQWGISIKYAIQPSPDGLPQALIIGENFIDHQPVTLILGDNIFYGPDLKKSLSLAFERASIGKGSTIFACKVEDPSRFGVVSFDEQGKVKSIVEKPKHPQSNYCVTGLYCYDSNAVEYAKQLLPSERNELEITDLNNIYLKKGKLSVNVMDDSMIWEDAGTIESLYKISETVRKSTTCNKGIPVCSPEIASYENNWVSKEKLKESVDKISKSSYGIGVNQYLEVN